MVQPKLENVSDSEKGTIDPSKTEKNCIVFTMRMEDDGAAFCLLCDIERTQESRSEWRCDLAC